MENDNSNEIDEFRQNLNFKRLKYILQYIFSINNCSMYYFFEEHFYIFKIFNIEKLSYISRIKLKVEYFKCI